MTADPLPFDEPDEDPAVLPHLIQTIIDDFGYEVVRREMGRFFPPTYPVASAPARFGDPETSHLAARRERDIGRFSAKSRQAKLLALFEMRDLTDQGATLHLVGSHGAPSAFDGCRRRCSDLRAVGYLKDTGRRKKNAGSDELSIIWRISEAGKQALRSLEETGWSR